MSAAPCLARSAPNAVAAIGITNQRETTVVWERATGRPLANAIVWQDRRTAELCAELAREGWGDHVAETTGLVIDPYFSATKLAWLLANVPGLDARARAGEVCFGTIDSFLLFRLTGGRLHATDATNAARTKLYDIRSGQWDEKLLDRLGVPRAMLPEVRDTQSDFGASEVRAFRRRHPHQGHGRRSAGRSLRAGLLQARHAEGDLRHGLLRARQYRHQKGDVRQPHAVDRFSSTRGAALLRAGRRDLHGRSHGAMAERRSRPDRIVGGERGLGARGRSKGARLPGAGLPGAWRALLGCRRASRHPRARAAPRRRPISWRRGSRRSPSRPAISSTRCGRTWRRAASPRPLHCGSMGA